MMKKAIYAVLLALAVPVSAFAERAEFVQLDSSGLKNGAVVMNVKAQCSNRENCPEFGFVRLKSNNPQLPSIQAKVRLEPAQGVVGEKGSIYLSGTLLAATPGRVDAMYQGAKNGAHMPALALSEAYEYRVEMLTVPLSGGRKLAQYRGGIDDVITLQN